MTKAMDTELWKAIPGFPGYDVSNHGRVRSYKQRSDSSGWTIADEPCRILKPGRDTNGYLLVQISNSEEICTCRIATLVLLAFWGPCPSGLEVCHNDGSRDNNHLDNLRYDTHKANLQDASRQTQWANGEAHAQSYYTDRFAKQLREEFASGMSTAELARKHDVPRNAVTQIVYGYHYKDAGGPIAPSPRLSNAEVEELRHKRAGGASLEELSKEYGLSVSGVSRMASGRSRKKVGGPIQLVPWQRPA